MKALTTVNNDELTISFPEIGEQLAHLTRDHLRRRLESDREKFWQKNEKFKTQSECLEKINQLSSEVIQYLRVSIDFQRTLRIPDDGHDHFLPPGLGSFPLRHIEDYADRLPAEWNERGGAILPIHPSEAMWLNFDCKYPVALKVGTGKVCAISGEGWGRGLNSAPQNYCILPNQLWLDGYCVEKGVIRQFVAAPLDKGVTVEEQLTGKGEWGGIQIEAWPLSPDIYWEEKLRYKVNCAWTEWLREGHGSLDVATAIRHVEEDAVGYQMGLASGGRMKQVIYEDARDPSDYISCDANRCFVHLCNASQWELTTGEAPPNTPPTSEDYSNRGLPWYDYYDEKQVALSETSKLAGIKSLKQLKDELGQKVLPDKPDEANPQVIIKHIKS